MRVISKSAMSSSILLAAAFLLTLVPLVQVNALSGSEWRAGRIIDDSVFTNANSMTVHDIQVFLNARVPTCDTWGTQPSEYGGGTRAQYAASRGYSTPFTCLKDYYEVPKTSPGPAEPANNYGGVPIPAGAQSAAQLISNAAIKYNISPKVLLVKLATESPGPLTSDDWPFERQYLYAMGAHCPDSGPGGAANCDANWAGFSLQMDEAAALLRWYLDSMTQSWWQYKKPYQNNSILWRVVESGCGASNVYIENKATAALYTYTPYQPNQAALNNLYGTGDGCSSYGNRNFWRVFNDWFGSSLAPNYAWQLTRQYVYTDSTKSTPASLDSLMPGQRAYVGFTALNTGNISWTNSGPNPTMLGTSQPFERSSQLYDSTWASRTRPARLQEATVAPGQTGTFEFWITAPTKASSTTLREYFNPLVEGVAWMPDIGLFFSGSVQPARYTWSMTSQYAYTDETKTSTPNMNSLLPGQRIYVGFTAKNTGNMTWLNNGPNAIMSGTIAPLERVSRFAGGSGWLTSTRPVLLKEASIAPGQTGTFEFWLTIPNSGTDGIFNERFSLVANNVTWMNDIGLSFYMNIQPARYTWSMTSQYAYTDSNKTTVADINNITPGQKVYVGFTAKNTGNMTWLNNGPNALMVGTAAPLERVSRFANGSGWLTGTRPTLLREPSVAPGQTGTFEFWLTTPTAQGTDGIYNERFNLIANGVTWLNDVGLSYYLNVH